MTQPCMVYEISDDIAPKLASADDWQAASQAPVALDVEFRACAIRSNSGVMLPFEVELPGWLVDEAGRLARVLSGDSKKDNGQLSATRRLGDVEIVFGELDSLILPVCPLTVAKSAVRSLAWSRAMGLAIAMLARVAIRAKLRLILNGDFIAQ